MLTFHTPCESCGEPHSHLMACGPVTVLSWCTMAVARDDVTVTDGIMELIGG